MRNSSVNAYCPKCGVTVMADVVQVPGRKADATRTVCPACHTVVHELIETGGRGAPRYEVKA